ncbi:D-mannonate dehydratase ManD [Saccharomonospora viridis]|uniref:D-mannonate dehydratase n=2 Tax=Saccharomonospora viridis TaxID=1852 RepID=C7MVR5_SACVD|nr:D-mannonate dehydratase ManD [Saccharomonospora viridis]ACU95784.1 D-mannonate dehydratase [Saccharomonospora viridis DSM 43017]KHF44001.1 D-altronate/D-mannonate dehydratase [Saccharomonospora viridis]SFP90076.1 mannonate dehydratase [Saccharomonospora viridis]
MKITDARVIVTCPGRNFVTLKIETDEGLTGVGDATLNGRELAVAAYLRDHVVPLLIGRDAHRIEDTWQYLYQGAYWRRGPVTMSAIAAVDTALWDIKGKAAGLPVYQLLGGRSREGVTVYGHANGETVDEVLDEVARYLDLGYRAVRLQCGVPGLPSTYGVGADKMFYEPARGTVPEENVWSTEKYLSFVPKLFARAREEFGPELRLLHDVHHRLTPIEAARLGRSLEPYGLYWLEDPVPADLQEGFRLIREHTTTPIAVGEVINSIWDCADLIRNQLIDFIRCTVVHAGGITHLRRIFDLAALHHVRSGSHGATDLSPVCMAAALHLDVSIPNFGLQEYMRHTEATDEVFPHGYHYADGYLFPGEEPGLGVDIDEEAAARYPYRQAYLPVNRLEDGTVHPW